MVDIRSIDYNHTPKYIRRRFENADSVINKIRTFAENSKPEEIHLRYMTGRNFHNDQSGRDSAQFQVSTASISISLIPKPLVILAAAVIMTSRRSC